MTVLYQDCLSGMQSLPDKAFDLCLTDPPYNLGVKNKCMGPGGRKARTANKEYSNQDRENMIDYEDSRPDYYPWILDVFHEIMRVCKRAIISPGRQNLQFWYRNTEPTDIFIHYKENGFYGSRIARYNRLEPYLFFGDFIRENMPHMPWNAVSMNSTCGFHSDKMGLNHPHPKSEKLSHYFLYNIKPASVLDPFLGSGTTAMVCEQLGIPWTGFEINSHYETDINRRIHAGKKIRAQCKLF